MTTQHTEEQEARPTCIEGRRARAYVGLRMALAVLFASCTIGACALGCKPSEEHTAESPVAEAEGEAAPAAETEAVPEGEARLEEVGPAELRALIASSPGTIVLVNMWSTWCAPCIEEFPDLVEVSNEFRSRGVAAIFVSADLQADRDGALAFLIEQGVPMPGYVKTGSDPDFIEAFDPRWSGTLPATVLFDAEREPRYFWEGVLGAEELRAAINTLLSES